MSKELEALEFICKILKEKGIDIKWLFKEQYNTIKQHLEQIENANPSEALECLDTIKEENCCEDNSIGTIYYDEYNTIKQALIKAEQDKKVIDELKALVKYADFNKSKYISLAVLKNALKEVL